MPPAGASRASAGLAALVLVGSCAIERQAAYYTSTAPSPRTPGAHIIGGGPDGGQVSSLALAAGRPTTIFASFEQGGVFKSTDGGSSWAPADHGLPERSLCALAADPDHPAVVYAHCLDELFKTIDAGASWLRLAIDFNYWSVATVAPSDSRVLYAFPPSRVFKSRDGGRQWAAVVASGLPDEQVSTAEVDPANPAVVYAGTPVGIFKSRDGGTSWTSTNRGLPLKLHAAKA